MFKLSEVGEEGDSNTPVSQIDVLINESTVLLPTLITMLKLSKNESTLKGAQVRLSDAMQIAEHLLRRAADARA